MKTKYYHGSPIPGLTLLVPKLDKRTGIEGVFVSNEPHGPCMYSLLPCRSSSKIHYSTDEVFEGMFIFMGGVVKSKFPLNEKGYVYEVISEVPPLSLDGKMYFDQEVACRLLSEVLLENVLKMGWRVELMNDK